MKPEPFSSIHTRGPIGWMAANPVAANLLMLLFLVGGLIFGLQIKQEVFPELELDMVAVQIPYPGASPEEVEQGIILAVEEAVRAEEGVKQISSVAREGGGTVYIDLLLGANVQRATEEIRNAVDSITTFPDDIETPRTYLMSRSRHVLSLVLYGTPGEKALRETAEQIRDQLLASEEITQVELDGVRPYEISIEISRDNLQAYGLTLEGVAAKIRQSSVEIPGGGIKTEGGEILLRVDERKDYGRQFRNIPIISTTTGARLLLGNIADIRDGFADTDAFAEYNGKPAIEIEVYRIGDQTPFSVSQAVKQTITEVRETLPPGIGIDIRSDRSEIFRQRMDLLLRNGYIGLCLVLGLLGLFLEFKLAFWVTLGIPISFLGSLLVLPGFDVSINMVSLFAFIVALGIVVDDAIVVGENIYEWRERGKGRLEAAIMGAKEVSTPVTFSILTNVITFMPLLFISGIMGKIFWMIPVVVILVFLVSLVESLFILPAHLAHTQSGFQSRMFRGIGEKQQRFSTFFTKLVKTVYGPFLARALSYRYLTFAVGLAVLIITLGYISSGRMGLVRFPRVDSDRAEVVAVLPYGTSVEKTKMVRDKLVAAAEKVIAENGGDKLSEGIYAQIGGGAGHSGTSGGHITEIDVYLTPPEIRPLNTKEFSNLWRREAGNIVGLESLSFRFTSGGPSSGAALTVDLSHRKIHVLEQAGAALADILSEFSEVKEVDDGFTPGKRQYNFKITPEGRSLGLTPMEVARQVRSAFYGAEAQRQQRDRNEVKVMVRLPEEERISEYDLMRLLLRAPSGAEIPISAAVEVDRGRSYTIINRKDGKRVITVTAEVDPPERAQNIRMDIVKNALPMLKNKFPGLGYSFEGKQRDMDDSMKDLRVGFLLAMLGVYGMLAVVFKSYIQPVIIMICIPFGIVGAVIGHLIMGYSLSIMSMMGMVALSGVVVNDSLVLIDFANRNRQDGESSFDAVQYAGIRRFRPIMLTTLTTFGGLAPMIFETSRQARFLIPMALSLGYGILFATVIALVLVPCLYLIVEDIQGLFGFRVTHLHGRAQHIHVSS